MSLILQFSNAGQPIRIRLLYKKQKKNKKKNKNKKQTNNKIDKNWDKLL